MASRARVAALLAGVLGSGALFASTWPLDAMVPRGQLGPGFWPRLALIGLAGRLAGRQASTGAPAP